MGNYRFRLSDMMPNAWFYKLRDMNKLKNQNPPHKKHHFSSSTQINPRKSFYYTTDSIRTDTNLCQSPHNPKLFDTPFPYDPPPKSSSTNESNRKTIYMPSPRTIAPRETVQNCFDSSEDCFLESGFEDDDDCDSLYDDDDEQYSISSCSCNLSSSVSHDIIIDVEESSYTSISVDSFSVVPEPELPPIVTKPTPFTASEKGLEKVKKNRRAARTGRKSVFSKVKIGRRVGGKKAGRSREKSVEGEKKGRFYSESLAIVKASFDPEKDFRESMMEMIVENNIRESKDLEDLLACYLTLNSNQYHELIIKAFEQIWFNMPRYN